MVNIKAGAAQKSCEEKGFPIITYFMKNRHGRPSKRISIEEKNHMKMTPCPQTRARFLKVKEERKGIRIQLFSPEAKEPPAKKTHNNWKKGDNTKRLFQAVKYWFGGNGDSIGTNGEEVSLNPFCVITDIIYNTLANYTKIYPTKRHNLERPSTETQFSTMKTESSLLMSYTVLI